jgi:hypothetical protein
MTSYCASYGKQMRLFSPHRYHVKLCNIERSFVRFATGHMQSMVDIRFVVAPSSNTWYSVTVCQQIKKRQIDTAM